MSRFPSWRDWIYVGLFPKHQLYALRMWTVSVSIKGSNNRPLFSERNRINCRSWPLFRGYRLTVRWKLL